MNADKHQKSAQGSASILQRLVIFYFKVPFIMWLLILLSVLTWANPYDDTDDEKNGVRSNMSLTTDYKTGCQYLSRGIFGGITPRLNSKGEHVGCR